MNCPICGALIYRGVCDVNAQDHFAVPDIEYFRWTRNEIDYAVMYLHGVGTKKLVVWRDDETVELDDINLSSFDSKQLGSFFEKIDTLLAFK